MMWRLQLIWWQFRDWRTLRDLRVRWAQDGGVDISDEQFGRWLDGLPTRDFIFLMLMSPADEPDEAEA